MPIAFSCGMRATVADSVEAMRYRQLGSSDLQVSEISLGSWLTYGGGVGSDQAEACVAAAFDAGINFIDTANVYARGQAEEFLGGVLADRPATRATSSRRSSSSRCPNRIAGSRASRC